MVRRSARIGVVGLTAVVTALLWASPCWACSCAQQTDQEHAAGADAIFTAVAERVEPTEGEFGREIAVTMAVDTAYKGAVPGRVVVETAADSPACGFPMEVGERYTIFAFAQGSGYSTSLCSASTKGDIDPAAFGLTASPVPPPEPLEDDPAAAPTATSEEGGSSVVLISAIVAVAVAGAVAIWVLVRRRRA